MLRKRIFVSHGTYLEVVEFIKKFLIELNVTPIVVEEQPDRGLPPDRKVRYYMKKCDGALIIATPDDRVRDYYQPRQNVIHEIALAEELMPKRTIYMKESKTRFPSNINPTYITFASERMDQPLLKLLVNLKSLGFVMFAADEGMDREEEYTLREISRIKREAFAALYLKSDSLCKQKIEELVVMRNEVGNGHIDPIIDALGDLGMEAAMNSDAIPIDASYGLRMLIIELELSRSSFIGRDFTERDFQTFRKAIAAIGTIAETSAEYRSSAKTLKAILIDLWTCAEAAIYNGQKDLVRIAVNALGKVAGLSIGAEYEAEGYVTKGFRKGVKLSLDFLQKIAREITDRRPDWTDVKELLRDTVKSIELEAGAHNVELA